MVRAAALWFVLAVVCPCAALGQKFVLPPGSTPAAPPAAAPTEPLQIEPSTTQDPPPPVLKVTPQADAVFKQQPQPQPQQPPAQQPQPQQPTRKAREPVFFNGVQLGASSPDDVAAAWGKPLKVSHQNPFLHHTYELAPFESVDVTFHQNKALSLVIHLKESFPPAELAEQLDLTEVEPVAVPNEAGAVAGQAYPERGVTFSFKAGARPPEVSQIVLEELDPRVFVLRAQARLRTNLTACLADLDAALEIEPRHAKAHWLQARVWHSVGHDNVALVAAEQALAIEPANPEYQLTRARILADLEQHKQSIEATEKAIAASASRPEAKARGVCQLGDLVALGPDHDHKLALDYHMQAIKLAEPLLADPKAATRRAARDVLIDAHQGAAVDVAQGNWKTRQTAVPKWLERARALASDPSLGAGDRDAELVALCSHALAACAGLDGHLDPTPWVDMLLENVEQRLAASNDPMLKQRLELDVGRALLEAVHAYHLRGDPAAARKCGMMAASTLAHVWSGRTPPLADGYKLARLRFRLGAIAAIEDHDHKQATAWYDKAVETLEQPAPESAAIDVGREGEALVSMAVSYWATGQEERALHLTRLGAEWITHAVKAGTIEANALAVPYANLASMHRHLGDADKAAEYDELANRANATKVR